MFEVHGSRREAGRVPHAPSLTGALRQPGVAALIPRCVAGQDERGQPGGVRLRRNQRAFQTPGGVTRGERSGFWPFRATFLPLRRLPLGVTAAIFYIGVKQTN